MRRYAVEFVGTFFVVLTIVTCVGARAVLAPLAIGGMLAALIYAGRQLSGAHYNPAVTLAVWIRGSFETREIRAYALAQIFGAVLGGATGRLLAGPTTAQPFSVSGGKVAAALVAETLVTFVVAYVVLHVDGDPFQGLAIGFTVMAGGIAVGTISGGIFNPAVALGVATAHLAAWPMLGIYLLADLTGGALAALAFRALNPSHPVLAVPVLAVPVPAPRPAPDDEAIPVQP
jgi:aquaporin Z